MPHRRSINSKAYDMAKAKTFSYTHSDHSLPHCKCVLRCYTKCPCIYLFDQETGDKYSDTTPSILFSSYHIISHCVENGSTPLNH